MFYSSSTTDMPSEPNEIDIFAATTRNDADIFFSRDDNNDPRLGEVLSRDERLYDKARVVLLGCPQDEGVRRNRGRVGAALAPTEIRRSLYRLSPPVEKEVLFDLGDTQIRGTLEETHELQLQIVRQLLRDGKRVIVLGGGNDISYPDCKALATEAPGLLAFNIDAHLDARADAERNSGTPYRQLLEEGTLSCRTTSSKWDTSEQ
ncbi:MAG: arginase family protein [Acidobacteriota bacterium]